MKEDEPSGRENNEYKDPEAGQGWCVSETEEQGWHTVND